MPVRRKDDFWALRCRFGEGKAGVLNVSDAV